MTSFSKSEINMFFPVVGLIAYPGGVMVRRNCLIELWGKQHEHERGKIVKVTARSLNRLALIVRSSSVNFSSVMTLTYGVNYPLSGRIAKKHLNAFFTDAKRKFGKFQYFWVIEFQGRGAPHFHVATTLPPPTHRDGDIFADIWSRVSTPGDWPYCRLRDKPDYGRDGVVFYTRLTVWEVANHPRSWEAVRDDRGMSKYLAKYANKIKQKDVPEHFQDIGRFWGVSRGVSLPDGEFFYGTEAEVREAIKLSGRNIENWEILPKTVLVG